MPFEVAELFGVSPRTIARWANRGRIGSTTLPSGHRRYRREDIERYLRERKRESASQTEGEVV